MSTPPWALSPETGQRGDPQTATLGMDDLPPLLHQTTASLPLLLPARLAGLRSLRTLKTSLPGLEQRKLLTIAAQPPVATGLKQLLLLTVGEIRFRHPSAWSRFSESAGLLQSSGCESDAGNQKCPSPAMGERHEDHQQ